MGQSTEKITKTFEDIHFKMPIPEMLDTGNKAVFRFKFVPRGYVDTIVEKCVFTDKLNKVSESKEDYTLFMRGEGGFASISIPYGTKKLFLRDAKVEFSFLCGNRQYITVVYSIDANHKMNFKHIRIREMEIWEFDEAGDLVDTLLEERGKKATQEEIHFDSTETEEYDSETVRKFSEALRQEIHFLKQGKGKRYKIATGEKINKEKGVYTYSFEMETELYLPDDAPVVVEVNSDVRASGVVLACEDFQILLLLNNDIGDKIRSAYLMVEPWKLLEGLNVRMKALNPRLNHIALKLLEDGPKYATTRDINDVPKGQEKVAERLNSDEIVAVWGPPGTGKTYTMATIAIDYIRHGKSVLVVSHSNVSVDGVINKVVELLGGVENSLLKEGKILRVGYVRDEKLSANPYATSFNYTLENCPAYKQRLDELVAKKEALKAKRQTKTPEYDETIKKIKRIRDEIRKEEHAYINHARMIGTTISKVTVNPEFENRYFDLVMFDEVSMAYVPQVVVAASVAREKFMCVGDFRQLAPIAQSESSKGRLQTDMFKYLGIINGDGDVFYHPWLVMLNEQRRMHPDISAFVNRYVYKNLLKDYRDEENLKELNEIVAAEPLSGDALNLINLAGAYCAADKNNDNSRYNILSAVVSFATAVQIANSGKESVGIISPYAAQVRLIRAMIQDYYGMKTTAIRCATVHQFQGSEADVIIFDAVESYPTPKAGFLMSKNPDDVVRLVNVAATRARGKLITVANSRFWENVFKGTDHILYKLLGYIQRGHKTIDVKEKTLQPYIGDIDPSGAVSVYTDESDALELFSKDMEKAKGRIVVSIPDGELTESGNKMIELFNKADSRGVDVLAKSNDYENLPEVWKEYCWGTVDATFPLVVIDDEVVWFGLPMSKLKLKTSKDTWATTVVPAFVRIKGTNTVEMIKSLTSLEEAEMNGNRKVLTKRKGTGKTVRVDGDVVHREGGSGRGLAAFVEEKEHCTKCKASMVLAKNARGVAYLKCSDKTCKETKYLEPDLMNWYISSRNVICPKRDKGELTGILGKFGPCIRCSCGHFMKPEEI